MAVLLETSLGDIVIDLYVEDRPKCCLNFVKLCKMKYYNFCLFHCVQKNFIAQSGDPTGSGEGGSSMWGQLRGGNAQGARFFDCELLPKKKHVAVGTVSMVNNGASQHGSQFLITLGADLDNLDGLHSVFGEVAEGHDVLEKLNEAFCDKEGKPYQDIRILHTIVVDDPFEDPPGLVVPERSPSPPAPSATDRIGFDEDINDFEGMTEEEIRGILETRASKANAQILEMIGDIPDADAKPPENVLFVCKLNPATTSEDLEVIFSRFGTILSCEVIRDQKTGDSLQYAFIEFEKEEDCVSAYFKMDNVLVDDRRIHVDFSQSLSKVKGLHKRPLPKEENEGQQNQDDGLALKQQYQKTDDYDFVYDDGHQAEGGASGRRVRKSENNGRKERRDREQEKPVHQRAGRSRSRSREREHHHKERARQPEDRQREKRSRSRSRDRVHSDHKRHHRSRSRERDSRRQRSRSRERDSRRQRSRSRERDSRRQRSQSRERDSRRKRSRSRERDSRRKRSRSRERDNRRQRIQPRERDRHRN